MVILNLMLFIQLLLIGNSFIRTFFFRFTGQVWVGAVDTVTCAYQTMHYQTPMDAVHTFYEDFSLPFTKEDIDPDKNCLMLDCSTQLISKVSCLDLYPHKCFVNCKFTLELITSNSQKNVLLIWFVIYLCC